MIIVSGTPRSGTSMWMHVLVAAGLPLIGERFPAGWGDLLSAANPDGLYESELIEGVYFRTNPHPLTGAYLAPDSTRHHAVKVVIPGLVRTDVAFIDHCVATVRSWRAYVVSTRRVAALQADRVDQASLPPALQWWCSNYALIRDLAIRGYRAHVVSYDGFLRDPNRVATEVLQWIGHGDAARAADIVRPELNTAGDRGAADDRELAGEIDRCHLEVFDELYAAIDSEQALTPSLVDQLNRTDEALRPLVLRHRAAAQTDAVADILGRR